MGGWWLIGQLAFRAGERLVNEMTVVNEGGSGGQINRFSEGS